MQKTLLLLGLFLFIKVSHAQQIRLSEQAEISVLTVGPGTTLNDAFGHSAFRMVDSNSVNDIVYNYGTFNFDDDNFLIKFIPSSYSQS